MSTIIESAYVVYGELMTENYVKLDFKKAASDGILAEIGELTVSSTNRLEIGLGDIFA